MSAQPPGPFDLAEWPAQLRARVVTPGPRPHVRGYDVEGDLARHYSFAEGVLIALGGEVPSEAQGRAFEIAMQYLSPAPVNEAPTHAAALCRISAGTDSGVIGTAAVGLAEQGRAAVAHPGVLVWLQEGGDPPDGALAKNDDERESVARLRDALRATGLSVPALGHDLGRTAAILAVLHACGLRSGYTLEAAWVIARLATSVAEAMTNKRRGFQAYPTLLPPIRYDEDPR